MVQNKNTSHFEKDIVARIVKPSDPSVYQVPSGVTKREWVRLLVSGMMELSLDSAALLQQAATSRHHRGGGGFPAAASVAAMASANPLAMNPVAAGNIAISAHLANLGWDLKCSFCYCICTG